MQPTNHDGRNPDGLTVVLPRASGIYPACGYASLVIKFVGEHSYKPAGRLKPPGRGGGPLVILLRYETALRQVDEAVALWLAVIVGDV